MKRRIVLSIAALFALFAGGITISTLQLRRSTSALKELLELHSIDEMRRRLTQRLQRAQNDLHVSSTVFANNLDGVVRNVRELEASAKGCSDCHHEPMITEILERLNQRVLDYEEGFSRFITAVGSDAWRQELQLEVSEIGDEVGSLALQMELLATPKLKERTSDVMDGIAISNRNLAWTLALCFLLALFVSSRLVAGVTRPVRHLLDATRQIADGNLGFQTGHQESGELGQLIDAFNRMSTSLEEKEEKIREDIENLRRLNDAVLSLHGSDGELLERQLVATVTELTGASHCGLLRRAPPAAEPELAFFPASGEGLAARALPPEEERSRLLARLQQGPLLVNPPESAPWDWLAAIDGAPVKNLVAVPLGEPGSPVEAVIALNKRNGEFLSADASSLGILANRFAIASENRRLFLDLKRQMQELQSTQRQLVQAEKLTALGTLSSGIAHDFNNIMAAILGHAQLAKKKLVAEAGRDNLEVIESATRRAADLTRQLLAFSRQAEPKSRRLEINGAVEHVAQLLSHTVDKRIAVKLELASPSPVTMADPSQIEQVVMNLCVNARDAMPEGGTLTLRTEEVELDDEFCRRHPPLSPGLHVRLIVADTGLGISDENLPRVFDPFFTTKKIGEGTGLGLSLVYGIVESHGGLCRVESREGEGTRFQVYLPVLAGAAAAEPAARPAGSSSHRGVLIADDEEDIRTFLTDALGSIGFRTWTAPDGIRAVELLRQEINRIDLVLLDINMPLAGGLEAFRELKRLKPDLKVLLITGLGVQSRAQEILDLGADGVLEKPFSLESLVHELGVHLRA